MHEARPARIFIGLKLAPEIARQLAELVRRSEDSNFRLVPPEDMHVTLLPPWNEPDLTEAFARLAAGLNGLREFPLTFTRVLYGPTLRHPRLLWAEGVAGNALVELRVALLKAFGTDNVRPFRPHVTLARLPKNGRKIARKAPLDRTLSLAQRVASVELFQSPQKGESGYQVRASFMLGPRRHVASSELA